MSNEIKIRKGLKLGELDAEADQNLLKACFIDTGPMKQLVDVGSPVSILLGRTGAGKSALLLKISDDVEHSSVLDPNDISIRFLEHSNIVQFFDQIGVKLDLFYRALWRHILTVELLKLRYNLRSESDKNGFMSRINQWTQRDRVKQKSLDYFREWGDKFWLNTDEQLRELTQKFTEDTEARVKSKYAGVEISLEGAKGLTNEVRTEIKSIATQVVSSMQINRLNEVLVLLADHAFKDKQKKYFILIDKLDEDWAETNTRCHFIRALIEETKSFRKLPQVKIITALRKDLLDLVFDKTRNSGFQEEKYEAYLSALQWSKNELQELLSIRIAEVYRRQYTSDNVKFKDIFPARERQNSGEPIDYILDRTLLRPRDTLQFVNECFTAAADRSRISWKSINNAEARYSNKRMKSLTEEWSDFYPALSVTLEVLRGLQHKFTRSAITNRAADIAEKLYSHKINGRPDPCVTAAKRMYQLEKGISEADFVSELLRCLYHVGAVGVKINTLIWSHTDQPSISRGETRKVNEIVVHKMLRYSLDIRGENIRS